MTSKQLQAKLNEMLAQGIKDVRALDINLYDIIPDVRVTDNKKRIGSAQDMNRAIVKFGGVAHVVSGKKPLFRISIAKSECSNDLDIKNTLYHEILHCAPNCQDHQRTWKSHAARVNAAYGLNITTTKDVTNAAETKKVAGSDVKEHIGKCFRDGNRTFKFTGFNGRPKNSCDIVDIANGKQFVCTPAYIAKRMEVSPCLFGASVDVEIPKPPKKEIDVESASKFVGKKVKNGHRGRKIFTVTSVNPNGGSKAVRLRDERGREYTGALGCVSNFVLV